MLTLFVRGLPPTTTETSLGQLFGGYGKVFDLKLSRDLFTGRARGIASVKMEGHEARLAIAGLDGHHFEGNMIYVSVDNGSNGGRRHR